jgi:Flp pilus assembly protein TadG
MKPRDEKGQAMVELAFSLPLLVILLFGIVEFGIAFNNYLTLTDAVRSGARQAAVSRFLANPTAATVTKVKAAAAGLNAPSINVTVTKPDGSAPSWTSGADVKVSATYPYSINVLGIVVSAGNLSSSTVERVE